MKTKNKIHGDYENEKQNILTRWKRKTKNKINRHDENEKQNTWTWTASTTTPYIYMQIGTSCKGNALQ